MIFLTRALLNPWRRVAARHNTRNGQIRIDSAPRMKAMSIVRNEPRNAKPAPGPT